MLRQLNPTPPQPLNERRTARFVPESRRHGDKYARTLEEAFGPGARLHIERDPLPGPTLNGYAVSVMVAALIVLLSWAVSQL